MTKEIFTRNVQRWATYSPKIAKQLLQHQPGQESTFKEEAEKWFLGLDMYNVATLIVYGVGSGSYYKAAKDWLLENPDHQLVFLEDDLDVIYRLFETELGKELIFDNQVWLQYFNIDELHKDENHLSSMPFFFFLGDIEITVNEEYAAKKSNIFADLTTHLQYLKNIKLWLLTENINMGKGFFKNFYRNLLTLPRSQLSDGMFNKFKGIPAIICGAGPSLDKNRAILETLRDRALIFGGGSAMNALNETGFLPHFGVGIDPNWTQFSRLLMNQAYETPFFYRLRMFSDALESIHGEHIFIRGSAGYNIAAWIEEKLSLGGERLQEGNNVINFSLAIAHALGCNPIIFVGVDLAYTQQSSYSKGVHQHPLYDLNANVMTKSIGEELLIKNDINGQPVHTLWKWIMESVWYTEYADVHKDIKLINSTEGGIGFEGIPNIPLKEVAEEYLKKTYDLDGMVHSEIQNAKMLPQVSEANIVAVITEIEKSLARCQLLCNKLKNDFEASYRNILEGKEPSKESTESIEALHQEEAYTNLLLQFNESFLAFSGKTIEEEYLEDINEEDQQKVQIKRVLINKRRYEFLEAVCSYNRNQISTVLQMSSVRNAVLNKLTVEIPPLETIPKFEGLYKSTFVDGKREGDSWYLYDSGELYSKLHYVKGIRDGEQKYYYKNGLLKTTMTYKNGMLDGEVKLFYPNGKQYRQIAFVNGARNGTETLWNLVGNPEFQIDYKDNNPVGISRAWYANGKLAREVQFDNNSKPISLKQWDAEGTLLPQESIVKDDYFDIISKQTGVLTHSLENLYDQIVHLTPSLPNVDLKKEIEEINAAMAQLKQLEENMQKEVSVDNGKESIWKTPSARRMMGKQLEEATKKMAEDIATMEHAIKMTTELMMKDEKEKQ